MNSHSIVRKVITPTKAMITAQAVDNEGNIHFILPPTTGLTGEQWEQHIELHYCQIGLTRHVLRRASEAPTNGIIYHIVVRPGNKINDGDRLTKNIRIAAEKKGWLKPHWEVACLILDTFTDEYLEQMNLQNIVTMHEPIKDSDDDTHIRCLLCSGRYNGDRLLTDYCGSLNFKWSHNSGFAFIVPPVWTAVRQVNSQI